MGFILHLLGNRVNMGLTKVKDRQISSQHFHNI